MEPIED